MPAENKFIAIHPHCALKHLEEPCLYDIKNDGLYEKPFKIWMDGMGPFPSAFHPGLRLEDKWNQYLLIHPMIAIPETMIFDPHHLPEAERFLEQEGPLVLKRRLGRRGRGLQRI